MLYFAFGPGGDAGVIHSQTGSKLAKKRELGVAKKEPRHAAGALRAKLFFLLRVGESESPHTSKVRPSLYSDTPNVDMEGAALPEHSRYALNSYGRYVQNIEGTALRRRSNPPKHRRSSPPSKEHPS